MFVLLLLMTPAAAVASEHINMADGVLADQSQDVVEQNATDYYKLVYAVTEASIVSDGAIRGIGFGYWGEVQTSPDAPGFDATSVVGACSLMLWRSHDAILSEVQTGPLAHLHAEHTMCSVREAASELCWEV